MLNTCDLHARTDSSTSAAQLLAERLQSGSSARSDTQDAAKNGQREAYGRPLGNWSTAVYNRGEDRDAAVNRANVTFC
ncbi:hypothetical protein CesoFtcFv8_016488 [Champsocephalus esox]|uniref:Uncharacterized protein n=1 Tax=Champsocephalus esox TaxID=159716 RepID=A0AAN8GS27_9TELE|nr:hypothetical protein CesoFtcFv8_016488 [Champsocephalus esox]